MEEMNGCGDLDVDLDVVGCGHRVVSDANRSVRGYFDQETGTSGNF